MHAAGCIAPAATLGLPLLMLHLFSPYLMMTTLTEPSGSLQPAAPAAQSAWPPLATSSVWQSLLKAAEAGEAPADSTGHAWQ